MILKGKDALYLKSELSDDLYKCPRCLEKVSMKELVSQDGVHCPECSRIATIKIIDDVGFVSWTCGIDEGRIDVEKLPELPSELRSRLQKDYGISEEEADKLSKVKERATLFEEIIEKDVKPSLASTFIVDTLVRELKYREMELTDFKHKGIVDLLSDYSQDKITWDILEDILRSSLDKDIIIKEVYEEYDYKSVEDDDLREVCLKVIEEEEDAVKDYKEGDENAINYLIGKAKKKTEGAADAQEARELFKEIID